MDNSTPTSKIISTGFIVALLAIFTFSIPVSWFATWWPPTSVERRGQRAKLMERVEAAGGWDAIRRDCIAFAAQNTNGVYSHWGDTNLPPAILALKPMMVEYYPQYGCVSMRIFGMHSTGGHSRPFFGLEVDTSTNSQGYKHGTGYDNGGVIGNHHSVAEQVTEGIYEIY
jgi:hypothetical protein